MQRWIAPCNSNNYNIGDAFMVLKEINWNQISSNMCVGDELFIYVSSPVREVKYRCLFTEVNLTTATINDEKFVLTNGVHNTRKHMKIKCISEFTDHRFKLEILCENGLKGQIQGPRRLRGELEDFICLNMDRE